MNFDQKKIHAQYEVSEEHLQARSQEFQDNPQFRRATLNMIAAHAVCKKSLDYFSTLPQKNEKMSLIVATYFGEIASSLEFLTTFHETKMAKPIPFQNSLHNSTLGFITIQFGFKGPAMTISADIHTDAAIESTAEALLQISDHVLVCTVDMVPDFLKENYKLSFPHIANNIGTARSYIVSKKLN